MYLNMPYMEQANVYLSSKAPDTIVTDGAVGTLRIHQGQSRDQQSCRCYLQQISLEQKRVH